MTNDPQQRPHTAGPDSLVVHADANNTGSSLLRVAHPAGPVRWLRDLGAADPSHRQHLRCGMGHAPAAFASVTLTALSSLPARCATRGDLAIRCSIERVMFEVPTQPTPVQPRI